MVEEERVFNSLDGLRSMISRPPLLKGFFAADLLRAGATRHLVGPFHESHLQPDARYFHNRLHFLLLTLMLENGGH